MEFEEMKKIWDSQNNEHIYAIDERTLHRRVIRKNVHVKRMASCTEWGLLFIMLGVALYMIIEGLLDKEWYQMPQAAVILALVGYIYKGRVNRLKREGHSDASLLGDLEQALRVLDYQIKRQRTFLWWFIIPTAAVILISVPYTYSEKPWWLWPILIGAFAFSWWLAKKELQCKILPKKNELESLRNLLISTEE